MTAAPAWAVIVGQVYRNPNRLEGNGVWILLGVVAGIVFLGTVVGLIRSTRSERRFERTRREQKAAATAGIVDELGVEVDRARTDITDVIIAAVLPGSPADHAGFQAGDLVTAVDGTALAGVDDLRGRIRRLRPGEPARVTVIRAGRASTLTVDASSEQLSGGSTAPG